MAAYLEYKWTEVFEGGKITAMLLDRMTHGRAYVSNMKGQYYKSKRALAEQNQRAGYYL